MIGRPLHSIMLEHMRLVMSQTCKILAFSLLQPLERQEHSLLCLHMSDTAEYSNLGCITPELFGGHRHYAQAHQPMSESG
jgi:hypothetical protein